MARSQVRKCENKPHTEAFLSSLFHVVDVTSWEERHCTSSSGAGRPSWCVPKLCLVEELRRRHRRCRSSTWWCCRCSDETEGTQDDRLLGHGGLAWARKCRQFSISQFFRQLATESVWRSLWRIEADSRFPGFSVGRWGRPLTTSCPEFRGCARSRACSGGMSWRLDAWWPPPPSRGAASCWWCGPETYPGNTPCRRSLFHKRISIWDRKSTCSIGDRRLFRIRSQRSRRRLSFLEPERDCKELVEEL